MSSRTSEKGTQAIEGTVLDRSTEDTVSPTDCIVSPTRTVVLCLLGRGYRGYYSLNNGVVVLRAFPQSPSSCPSKPPSHHDDSGVESRDGMRGLTGVGVRNEHQRSTDGLEVCIIEVWLCLPPSRHRRSTRANSHHSFLKGFRGSKVYKTVENNRL